MTISKSESSPDTPDLMNQGRESDRAPSSDDGGAKSAPELELLNFIDSVAKLVGPCSARTLTELWLDELACMDCQPNLNGRNWRMVSLAASTRLAEELIARQLKSS